MMLNIRTTVFILVATCLNLHEKKSKKELKLTDFFFKGKEREGGF